MKKNDLPTPQWRVHFLKVMPYKDAKIYLRWIEGNDDKKSVNYGDYFEYLIIFEDKLYTQFICVPLSARKKIGDKKVIERAGALIWAAAITTVDTLLDEKTKSNQAQS